MEKRIEQLDQEYSGPSASYDFGTVPKLIALLGLATPVALEWWTVIVLGKPLDIIAYAKGISLVIAGIGVMWRLQRPESGTSAAIRTYVAKKLTKPSQDK